MKYPLYNILCIAVAGMTVFSIASCDYADGVGNDSENGVYLETPGNKGVVSFTLESMGGTTTLTPRLANITNVPVDIQLSYDKQALEKYNREAGTAYEPLPETAFKLFNGEGQEFNGTATITVPSGDFSTRVGVSVGKLNPEEFPANRKYAIPLSITSASKYTTIPSQCSAILLLNRSIVTSVGKMTGGDGVRVQPVGMHNKPEWTLQLSAIYSSLNRSNLTTIYFNDAKGEFYTRIDATQGIQVKNGRDGADTWTQIPLQAGKWLNISFVHKDKKTTVYVNGKVQRVFENSTISFNENTHFTIGNTSYNNDYIREVRLWDKALTEAEIIDCLYLPMNPDTPHLISYLPFTKEASKEIDGYKYPIDLKVPDGSNIPKRTNPTKIIFIENVKFPADELVIVEADK
ncbi:DUF1735 and LamG domain-containing protein [Macellibacteroides fermentans]|uniref:BT-3987-like N-terminal domain-containing protein n=1 Tax=Macellibacteroides fermentans TaxID=879969 RepID=A0A8E2D789_9PORP|nr:DUF1735 and LamG domain-containing protein [Macellibacteroides fermentans]NYI49044.1 hypothetical protein [Macellibacteroides fermentans]